jgi:hypothetical protein
LHAPSITLIVGNGLNNDVYACVRAEFTPGRAKGIDYMFAGENRRLKKTVAAPTSTEAPSSEFNVHHTSSQQQAAA